MSIEARCEVCGQSFEPRFRYQQVTVGDTTAVCCSAKCYEAKLSADSCRCDVCQQPFALEYPFQVVVRGHQRHYFCSATCRNSASRNALGDVGVSSPHKRAPKRIAVFNHKGGTGKTTTAINLAAGLAETGAKVLLVDADAQGNVGASLGIRGAYSLYHVLVLGTSVQDAAVPVRNNLDVLTANETLAAAELHLATRPQRDRRMREKLARSEEHYDVVVIDCAPALSLMNQNALVYADQVLVPVSCDYLALIGLRQVVKTLQHIRDTLRHNIRLLGVLPTMYDRRQRLAQDSLATLRANFGERCLEPIRANTRLREAPMAKQSIFEYAPDSPGAQDYAALVQRVQRSAEFDSLVTEPASSESASSEPATTDAMKAAMTWHDAAATMAADQLSAAAPYSSGAAYAQGAPA